jgi:hypothetical protein
VVDLVHEEGRTDGTLSPAVAGGGAGA